jgi:hypothetical protein
VTHPSSGRWRRAWPQGSNRDLRSQISAWARLPAGPDAGCSTAASGRTAVRRRSPTVLDTGITLASGGFRLDGGSARDPHTECGRQRTRGQRQQLAAATTATAAHPAARRNAAVVGSRNVVTRPVCTSRPWLSPRGAAPTTPCCTRTERTERTRAHPSAPEQYGARDRSRRRSHRPPPRPPPVRRDGTATPADGCASRFAVLGHQGDPDPAGQFDIPGACELRVARTTSRSHAHIRLRRPTDHGCSTDEIDGTRRRPSSHAARTGQQGLGHQGDPFAKRDAQPSADPGLSRRSPRVPPRPTP